MSYVTLIWSWMVRPNPFDSNLDGLWIVSTTPLGHVQVCYVLPHEYFLFNKVIYVWINSNMGVCVSWGCCFCWSLCAHDSQLIWKFAWHLNSTYPNIYYWNLLVRHVLVGVNSCVVVALLFQIAKLPKK